MQVKGKCPNKRPRPRPRCKEKIGKDIIMKVGIWDETAEMEPWEDRERCRGLVAA
jgi:hypothetical protein